MQTFDTKMTWQFHDDFEKFCTYIDSGVQKICPIVPCFLRLELENFSFSPKIISQAQKMFYFHSKHNFLNSDVIFDSNHQLNFSIKSSCSTKIYEVSITYPEHSISVSDCVNQIEYWCTCKHFVYFRTSNRNSKHCKHIIYSILNLINN